MRLFVAVEVDDAIRAVASAAIDALRHDRAVRRLDPRWVAAENLHVTVRFIGHVADDVAPAVVDALTVPVDLPAFSMTVAGCGAFPPSGPVRVIWLGIPDGRDGLAAISDEMNRRLQPFGFEPEKRPFSAHLTLARVKDAPRGVSADARAALDRVEAPPLSCPVRQATLFHSQLSQRGPRYEPLARIPLIGPSPVVR
jgi:2'-5' RNA ligase